LKWTAIIGIVLFLFSCGKTEEEVVDLSEVIPQAEKDYEEVEENETLLESSYEEIFLQSFPEEVDLEPIQKRLFPDRFGTDTSYHYEIIIKTDTLNYHKWIYSDSVKTVNAFYNWIDCFGSNCRSFFIGAEENMQPEAMLLTVNDTCMIYLTGDVDHKKWLEFFEENGYKKEWYYFVEQRKSGRARWYHFENNERIKYLK
jgi:hypothetical protein